MATINNNNNNKTKRNSNHQHHRNTATAAVAPIMMGEQKRQRILVLHGNQQTGQLLLGRMDKLRKQLLKTCNIEFMALDAPFPHPDDPQMKTWWIRRNDNDNYYEGLEESMRVVEQAWNNSSRCCGLLGFSQGARLVHLLAMRHHDYPHQFLVGLECVIQVAGYDAPLPDNYSWRSNNNNNNNTPAADAADDTTTTSSTISVPSLHVWGERDRLIYPHQSQAVVAHYSDTCTHVHDTGHHVPMRAASVRAYVEFIRQHCCRNNNNTSSNNNTEPIVTMTSAGDPKSNSDSNNDNRNKKQESDGSVQPKSSPSSAAGATLENESSVQNDTILIPDEETTLQQQEEVEALQTIYPDEFHLLSQCHVNEDDNDTMIRYEHPIVYTLDLPASDQGIWPPHPIQLHVTYPPDYPSNSIPQLRLQHHNDGLQFSSSQSADCLDRIYRAAYAELGMPCVLSCWYAAREYFESGAMQMAQTATTTANNDDDHSTSDVELEEESSPSRLTPASLERIQECNRQGLEIAEHLLYGTKNGQPLESSTAAKDASTAASKVTGKGGQWQFTIGLVGKPSAGKSTLFNTATGFARQRQQQASAAGGGASESSNKKSGADVVADTIDSLGGATMAPHPFTTIDPNVGFCLVPAPLGSCPEENSQGGILIGSTHGRDSCGRRLLPVLLKDVAGLVPGAYQGRGRGNQFLNDLTDADVLIHVLDASGRADPEGNIVVGDNDEEDKEGKSTGSRSTLHPLNDMAWIQNELIEWVYTNLAFKWDTIRRKGRSKLQDMFGGYGQPQAMTWNLLTAVERYLELHEHRENALDHLDEWDSGDLHRLVSAFLGVRFPIALALNKRDLKGSQKHIEDILTALPIYGTHVGTPLSAHREMLFTRREIEAVIRGAAPKKTNDLSEIPVGTWHCLQSAVSLRRPLLVFPVMDHTTYAPLPGMFKYATGDASLPSPGMISCLKAAGGCAPTEWDSDTGHYLVSKTGSSGKKAASHAAGLRDAILMKPGSTVEDVFLALKKLGALSGEFVRAEASGEIGAPAKPIPKYQTITRETRILKIMTNKRTSWQSNYS